MTLRIFFKALFLNVVIYLDTLNFHSPQHVNLLTILNLFNFQAVGDSSITCIYKGHLVSTRLLGWFLNCSSRCNRCPHPTAAFSARDSQCIILFSPHPLDWQCTTFLLACHLASLGPSIQWFLQWPLEEMLSWAVLRKGNGTSIRLAPGWRKSPDTLFPKNQI
jgi:hypothetical protein